MSPICFNATSSLIAGGSAYAVAAYLLRRNHPRLKWGGATLAGITATQWVEGLLWLDGPTPHGTVNQLLTVGLIPLALLAQAWGPLFGSTFDQPIRPRRWTFFLLMSLALIMVITARSIYHPTFTQITPEGHLNWWSPQNPPVFSPWWYGLWAVVIGAPFLLWWRPFWQALLVVSWGWLWAIISFLISDSAASYWCFFAVFYAAFLLIYAVMVTDEARPNSQIHTDSSL